MQAKFINTYFPRIELWPDGIPFESFSGRVEVHFLAIDEMGYLVDKPHIKVNVHFGELTPEQASMWGDIIKDASYIAQFKAMPWFSDNVRQAIQEAVNFLSEKSLAQEVTQ